VPKRDFAGVTATLSRTNAASANNALPISAVPAVLQWTATCVNRPPYGPYSNPQRLRPPRWTSQRVIATEATTAIMRMAVVIALIYR
jgi:hypothetical protein